MANYDWQERNRYNERDDQSDRYGDRYEEWRRAMGITRDTDPNQRFSRDREWSRGMRETGWPMDRSMSRGRDLDRDFSWGRDYDRGIGHRDFGWGRDMGGRDLGGIGYREYGGMGQRDWSSRDYGSRDYGSRDYQRDDDRSLMDRVREFFGRESNERPRMRGPKGWKRSDERIYEQVCEILADSDIDSSDVTVRVESGEVMLEGTVPTRHDKRMAEILSERVRGANDVHNHLRVKRDESLSTSETRVGSTQAQQRGANDRKGREGSIS
jgi:hypothetical protein